MATGFTHERPNEGETNVWLTPQPIIADLGPFDLDPCAAPEPRPWPTATRHYAEPQDGLTLPWEGLVWLNPPYGPQTGLWLDRGAQHRNGIALVFARPETIWFQRAVCHADAVLFKAGRIAFCLPDGSVGERGATAASAFFAYGAVAVDRLAVSSIPGFLVKPLPRHARAMQPGLF